MPIKQYEVIRVIDGDTIKVKDNGKERSLRLTGIDTPEKTQGAHALAAAEYLKSRFNPGDMVDFLAAKQGFQVRYRRRVGYVIKNGKVVNVLLVGEGLAYPFPVYPNFEFVRQIRRAGLRARRLKKGVYHPEDPIEQVPYEYRLRGGKKPIFYVGNVTSKLFYLPEEYPHVVVENRIFFAKEADAITFGYRFRKRRPKL